MKFSDFKIGDEVEYELGTDNYNYAPRWNLRYDRGSSGSWKKDIVKEIDESQKQIFLDGCRWWFFPDTLRKVETNKSIAQYKCRCEIFSLMNFGCKCGGT